MSFDEKTVGKYLIGEAFSGRLSFEELSSHIDQPPYINYSEQYGFLWHQIWHYLSDEDIWEADSEYETVMRDKILEIFAGFDDG